MQPVAGEQGGSPIQPNGSSFLPGRGRLARLPFACDQYNWTHNSWSQLGLFLVFVRPIRSILESHHPQAGSHHPQISSPSGLL